MTERNFNDTMSDGGEFRLKATLRVRGKCLDIYSLRVNGDDELAGLISALSREAEGGGGRASEAAALLVKIGNFVPHVANEGIACSTQLLRHISLWQDQWEIRLQQGRTQHRLYGFMVGGKELYLVRHRVKAQEQPDPADLRYVDAVRRAWLARVQQYESR